MELREKQFEAELRKAQLEKELVRHKMEEKLKDQESGEQKAVKMKKKVEFKSQETIPYSTKHVEIQKTIKDSNKTFAQIRNELARLKTKNEQLEKEKQN